MIAAKPIARGTAETLSISAAELYACARPRLREDSTAKLIHKYPTLRP
jgi:hypothetical protein